MNTFYKFNLILPMVLLLIFSGCLKDDNEASSSHVTDDNSQIELRNQRFDITGSMSVDNCCVTITLTSDYNWNYVANAGYFNHEINSVTQNAIYNGSLYWQLIPGDPDHRYYAEYVICGSSGDVIETSLQHPNLIPNSGTIVTQLGTITLDCEEQCCFYACWGDISCCDVEGIIIDNGVASSNTPFNFDFSSLDIGTFPYVLDDALENLGYSTTVQFVYGLEGINCTKGSSNEDLPAVLICFDPEGAITDLILDLDCEPGQNFDDTQFHPYCFE